MESSNQENATDEFLYDRYLQQHDAAMQRKFRRLCPLPVGVVFIQHPEMDYEDMRRHFRLMRELGFTALKQCQVCRGFDQKKVMHIALDEGIIPWWYGEAGWEDPTPELLEELGLDPNISTEELYANEVWLERQKKIMHARIDAIGPGRTGVKVDEEMPDRKRGPDWVPSVQPTFDFPITEEQTPHFVAWLKRQYGTIETLNRAWNTHHCMIGGPRNVGEMDKDTIGWRSWEHLEADLPEVLNKEFREYRRIRDVYRFKADNYINWLRDRLDADLERDRNAPLRAGGEMGLFLPFASRGTDMEGIAELMKDRGSFYPSFHPAWHFEEVSFEFTRPIYMQASISTDWFKGGWNASWESTGGPQQMTGHKAPFVPKVRDLKPGFTIDEGAMRQLMLSWIAAGYRGFGQWAWTVRTAGWEAGEFGLLDRNYRVTARARIAGRIGQACRRLRSELWQARKEPVVGIFQDWDMEAIWAATSRGGRDFFKSEPIRARIGAARSLINANIPWEHVTATDLRNGLAGRYKSIILPAALALSEELLEILHGFVVGGGRVILDAPGAWYDYYGRLLSTDDGTPFEKLFGCRIADYQFSSSISRPWRIGGYQVSGCTLDLQPTTAAVAVEFDHSTPECVRPAVTVNRLGRGAAIIMGYEATIMCADPGNETVEGWVVEQAMGELQSPYACDGAIVYRLASPTADHYFLLNDGDAVRVNLDTRNYVYRGVEDPLADGPVELGGPIDIAAYSARWLRYLK